MGDHAERSDALHDEKARRCQELMEQWAKDDRPAPKSR